MIKVFVNRRSNGWYLVVLFSLGAHSCESGTHGDGFCGLESSRAVARDLGVPWSINAKTTRLEQQGIATFAQVSDAIESLGLNVRACQLSQASAVGVHALFDRFDGRILGIAWCRSADTATSGVGHFMVVTHVSAAGEIFSYDAETNQAGRMDTRRGGSIPLLLVTTEPLMGPGVLESSLFALRAGMGSIGLSVALVAAMILLIWPTKKTTISNREQATITKLPPRVFWLMGLIVAVGLVGAVVAAVVMAPKSGDLSKGLAFSKSKYELGELILGSGDPVPVLLHNRSTKRVKVKGFELSCGCMSPEPREFEIAENGSQEVKIKFSTFQLGKNQFGMTAVGERGEFARCELEFVGIQSARLLPRKLVLGAITADGQQTLRHRLTIDGYRGPSLEGVTVETDSKEEGPFEIRLAENAVFENGGSLWLEISAKPSTLVRGLHFERVTIIAGEDKYRMSLTAEMGVEIVDPEGGAVDDRQTQN